MKIMESIQAATVLQDPAAARAALKRNGYLFIRGVFKREDVLNIRTKLLENLQELNLLAEGSSLQDARTIPRSQISNEVLHNLLVKSYGVEAIHKLWHSNDVLDLMQALIGKNDVIPHPHKQVRFQFAAEPGFPAQTTDAHQDYAYNQGSVDMYSCWTAVGDLTPKNGVLEVLENSHKKGLLEIYAPTPGSITYSMDEEDLQGEWLTSDYQMGDMVIFHSYTIHRVPANESDVVRLSTDCRFQSISEPFNSKWMTPLPGVIEASEHWENKEILNYRQNLDLILVEHDESYFNKMGRVKQ